MFAQHQLRFTIPRSFAIGYVCVQFEGLRAFLRGGPRWNGTLFKDRRAAKRENHCLSAKAVEDSGYLHLRRGNLVIVAKVGVRRRIEAALADL